MHEPVLKEGSFSEFLDYVERKYTGNSNYKRRVHDVFKRIYKNKARSERTWKVALDFAAGNTGDERTKSHLSTVGPHFVSDLSVGDGHRVKCAAVHYYILAKHPLEGREINQYVLKGEVIEGIFEYGPVSTPPSQPIASPTLTETAPFSWPLHVPKSIAFAEEAHVGVWLNPHNHYSIPLFGREREKELLNEFVEHSRHFLIGAVIGPSGAGKTRLVSEWMQPYIATNQDSDWDAGFVNNRDASPWHAENWSPTKNTLIIIDYTYNYDLVLGAIIARFKSDAPKKIRLLILDHILPDKLHTDFAWKQRFRNQGILDVEGRMFFHQFPIVLEPEVDDSALLRHVIACSADPCSEKRRYSPDSDVVTRAAGALMKIGGISQEDPTEDAIRRRDSIRHPLFAALIGQAIYRNPDADLSGLTRRDLIAHYLERDQRIPWQVSEQNKHAETLGPWVGCYVSAATLLGGVAAREMHAHLPKAVRKTLSRSGQLRSLIQYCNRVTSRKDNRFIKPLEPDILGEAFLLRFVENFCFDDEIFDAFVLMLSIHKSPDAERSAAANFLESLQRLIRNLINDDQKDAAVEKSWDALFGLLTPERFPEGALMRHAVSVALGDAIKQCRIAGLDDLVLGLTSKVNLTYFRDATTDVLWYKSAIGAVHLFEYLTSVRRVTRQDEDALTYIVRNFRQRFEDGLPAIMLPVDEGCLAAAKSVRRLFDESISSNEGQEWTPLMSAASKGYVRIVDWLIAEGVDPAVARLEDGWTPLMVACQVGYLKVVERLIGAGVEVDKGTKGIGWTALLSASHEGHLKIVGYLIRTGATVDRGTTENGWTALMSASHEGHVDVVDYLIQAGASVDQGTTDKGWTALMAASFSGHGDVVKRLLRAGATVDQKGSTDCQTALMFASNRGHFDVVDLIIKAGADIDHLGKEPDMTALLLACQAGHKAVVDLLIRAGANVNLGSIKDGWTPLILASGSGNDDVVARLIEANATIDLKAEQGGATALMAASLGGNLRIVERLIAAGARVDAKTLIGKTALMFASHAGYADIVTCLIEAGADFDLRTTDDGATALMLACQEGHIEVVDCLIGASANLDFQTFGAGMTALMTACWKGNVPVVDRLIKAGAKVDVARTGQGATALIMASQHGHSDVVNCLVEAGADVNYETPDICWTALMVACSARRSVSIESALRVATSIKNDYDGEDSIQMTLVTPANRTDIDDKIVEIFGSRSDTDSDERVVKSPRLVHDGYLNTVKVLVEAGANIRHGALGIGYSPLMAAARAGNLDIVEYLVRAGAPIDCRTTDVGATALLYARHAGQSKVVNRLIEVGAVDGLNSDGTRKVPMILRSVWSRLRRSFSGIWRS